MKMVNKIEEHILGSLKSQLKEYGLNPKHWHLKLPSSQDGYIEIINNNDSGFLVRGKAHLSFKDKQIITCWKSLEFN